MGKLPNLKLREYWVSVNIARNIANMKDRSKAKDQRHRLYVASGEKKFLKMRRPVTTEDVRRAFRKARKKAERNARLLTRQFNKGKGPRAGPLDQLIAAELAILFEDEDYPNAVDESP